MNTSATSINELWANLLVEELVRNGMTHFVLSPGSRSTPLTVAVARHPGTTSVMHFDERGAAFYALGYARACGRPAPLICTSGTAAANYYPAVIEGWQDFVPMVLLTADRPPELRGRGANQTIDQISLYGKYTVYEMDLPCPDEQKDPSALLAVVSRAVYRAATYPRGPAQLNCPFREPLAPTGEVRDFSYYLRPVSNWLDDSTPFVSGPTRPDEPAEPDVGLLATECAKIKRGILVVGGLRTVEERQGVQSLASGLGWPVFPDIQSGLRMGSTGYISYYDQILLNKGISPPDGIIHIGGELVSKRFNDWIGRVHPDVYIRISGHGRRSDPNYAVTTQVRGSVTENCRRLEGVLGDRTESDYREYWQSLDGIVGNAIDSFLNEQESLSEVHVLRSVTRHISSDALLFLASSMPVRDADMFADPDGTAVSCLANRGASGIDGTVACSAGVSAGGQKPVTVVIGDLGFLHDMNSLALFAQCAHPVTIVLVNNGGGGIFSFLPIQRVSDVFERYFGTPHAYSFEKTASQFDLSYHRPATRAEFDQVYAEAQESGGHRVIEVKSDREGNREFHLALYARIQGALERSTVNAGRN